MIITRERLHELAHAVLDALARRDPQAVPCAPGCRYTENGRDLPLRDGLFATATAVGYRYVVVDAENEQAAVFAVVNEGQAQVIYGLRLRVTGEHIVEMESVVARNGEASAFAPERLLRPNPLFDQSVLFELRQDRERLREAADRYFDGIEQNSSADVPFHASCVRVENGVQTTDNPQFLGGVGCREQLDLKLFSYIEKVRERRYPVTDPERGLVFACAFLDVPGTVTTIELHGHTVELPPRLRVPRSVLLFELFKVIGFEIHTIEAFMVNLRYQAPSGWTP